MEYNNDSSTQSIPQEYPVIFEARYLEKSSRLLALLGIPWFFLKMALLIPRLVVLWFLNFVMVVVWFRFWSVLFTGKYPRVLFDFVVGVMRWQNRINTWIYGLTDRYPPFLL